MKIIEYLEQMWLLAIDGEVQGVFFWASFYALTVMLYSLRFQINVRSWPSTAGELVDEKINEFGYAHAHSHKEYKVSLIYKYTVEDREYTGTRLSPWLFITNDNAAFILKKQLNSVARKSDGSVLVFYNPKNPQKSFLIKPGRIGMMITLSLSIIPFILYWQKFYG